jgi:hypothetical protein
VRYVLSMTDAGQVQAQSQSPTDQIFDSPTAPNPGRTLGIVGFVFSFVTPFNIAGLVLCIVALVKSRRAGQKYGLALAGIIIAVVGILLSILIISVIAPILIDVVQTCARLGNGVHVIGNSVYTCTPTSSNVSTHS